MPLRPHDIIFLCAEPLDAFGERELYGVLDDLGVTYSDRPREPSTFVCDQLVQSLYPAAVFLLQCSQWWGQRLFILSRLLLPRIRLSKIPPVGCQITIRLATARNTSRVTLSALWECLPPARAEEHAITNEPLKNLHS